MGNVGSWHSNPQPPMKPEEIQELLNNFNEIQLKRENPLKHASQRDLINYLNWSIPREGEFTERMSQRRFSEILQNSNNNQYVIELIQQRFYGYFTNQNNLLRALRDIPALIRYSSVPVKHNHILSIELYDKIGINEVMNVVNHYLDEEKDEDIALTIVTKPLAYLRRVSPIFLKDNIRNLNRFPRIRNLLPPPSPSPPSSPLWSSEEMKLVLRYLQNRRVSIWALKSPKSPSISPTSPSQKKLKTEPVCSICLNDFDKTEPVVDLDCGHRFHEKCIYHWLLKGELNCPNCRAPLLISPEQPDRPIRNWSRRNWSSPS
jgi:hypothetical protein